jgi:hypothetical protein
MTGFPDPPGRRENPQQNPPPYPYQFRPGPHPGGYPPPPPPPYYGYPPPPSAPKNGLGIASLILAIVALVSVWSVFAPVILGVIAVVVGFLGHGRVKRGTADNGGVAIAGIVLGGLAIVVGLAFIAIWTALWKDVGGGDYIDCMQKAGTDQAQQQQCSEQFQHNVQDRLSVTLTPTPIP